MSESSPMHHPITCFKQVWTASSEDDLREELKGCGCSDQGNRDELISRLTEYFSNLINQKIRDITNAGLSQVLRSRGRSDRGNRDELISRFDNDEEMIDALVHAIIQWSSQSAASTSHSENGSYEIGDQHRWDAYSLYSDAKLRQVLRNRRCDEQGNNHELISRLENDDYEFREMLRSGGVDVYRLDDGHGDPQRKFRWYNYNLFSDERLRQELRAYGLVELGSRDELIVRLEDKDNKFRQRLRSWGVDIYRIEDVDDEFIRGLRALGLDNLAHSLNSEFNGRQNSPNLSNSPEYHSETREKKMRKRKREEKELQEEREELEERLEAEREKEKRQNPPNFLNSPVFSWSPDYHLKSPEYHLKSPEYHPNSPEYHPNSPEYHSNSPEIRSPTPQPRPAKRRRLNLKQQEVENKRLQGEQKRAIAAQRAEQARAVATEHTEIESRRLQQQVEYEAQRQQIELDQLRKGDASVVHRGAFERSESGRDYETIAEITVNPVVGWRNFAVHLNEDTSWAMHIVPMTDEDLEEYTTLNRIPHLFLGKECLPVNFTNLSELRGLAEGYFDRPWHDVIANKAGYYFLIGPLSIPLEGSRQKAKEFYEKNHMSKFFDKDWVLNFELKNVEF